MARAWSGNSGIQLAGTPMSELLCWIPDRFALLAIRTRACAIPWFSVTFVDVALYAEKAESQFGIGTPDAPSSWKPPLSRWLVVVIEELTSAWIPDIVAIVNMTSAMLASVAPVRNFLRSEEHTSELQSPCNLVCRLLLEKKKKKKTITNHSIK